VTAPGTGRSDEELIDAVRRGDLGAYAALYRRYVEQAQRAARQCASGFADQQDLVAEAFVRVLTAIRGGGGPRDNLRPYLQVAIRNLATNRWNDQRRLDLNGGNRVVEPSLVPAAAGSDEIVMRHWRHRLVRSAFRALPARWRLVLWHLEVNGVSPSELAPMLDLSPNAVSALAMRAREGLRKAYLQVQVPESSEPSCRAARARMGAWLRGGLEQRKASPIAEHVEECAACLAVVVELSEVNRELRPPTGRFPGEERATCL
jgi:RNA polymerase sigma factor (sigma-70 family)